MSDRARKLTDVERKHCRALAGSLLFGGELKDEVVAQLFEWLVDRGWPRRDALLRAREVYLAVEQEGSWRVPCP
jgi:hypothetical protein